MVISSLAPYCLNSLSENVRPNNYELFDDIFFLPSFHTSLSLSFGLVFDSIDDDEINSNFEIEPQFISQITALYLSRDAMHLNWYIHS